MTQPVHPGAVARAADRLLLTAAAVPGEHATPDAPRTHTHATRTRTSHLALSILLGAFAPVSGHYLHTQMGELRSSTAVLYSTPDDAGFLP